MAEWNDGASTDSGRSLGQHDASSGSADPAAIRAGINETRERLSDTLSEIGERLNPQLVKEQVTERVKEGIREATIGRVEHMARSARNSVNATRNGITDTIRDNPVPAAMVAIGLGWMFFNGRRGSSESSSYRFSADYESPLEGTTGSYARTSDSGSYPYDSEYAGMEGGSRGRGRVRQAREAVSERVSDVAGSVKDKAGHLADRTRDAASSVSERAHNVADSVSTRARGVADSVSTRASQGRRRLEDSFQDNPLALGAVTMALGVVAGLAAPKTDREVRLMGDARDRVVDRARDVVDEAKEKVQEVAGRAKDEARRFVQDEKQNLKSESGGTIDPYAPSTL